MYLRRVIEEWPRCYSPRYKGAKCRSDLRGWIIYSWIALPTMRNACRRHTGLNRGGFFLHMVKGEPNRASAGTTVSTIGAYYLLACLRHWCMGCLPFAEVLTVEDWRRSSWTPFPLRKSGDVKGTICSDTQYPMASRDVRRQRLISICRLTMNHSESAVFLRSLAIRCVSCGSDFSELPGSGGAGHRFAAIGTRDQQPRRMALLQTHSRRIDSQGPR